ncbi:MAG TPA: hypothetical protein VE082_07525, partial [Desulfobaccales bacterium]|nr:hypothetical protein [Desulfobaccales bacterium]
MNKAMLIVMDGLGDRPVQELGGLAPLEAAHTPHLDALAARGVTGVMNALGVGLRPGSDTSHLAILGYDIERFYTGRGTIEVSGLGMDLEPGDVALRGNLGTVDDHLTVVDRRAGRITDTGPFVKDLDGLSYEGVTLKVRPGTGHRAGVILRGPGLSSRLSDNDPHEVGVKVHEVHPLDDSKEAAFTGMDVLNVPGATGLPNTDIEAKFRAGLDALAGPYDFAFVHIKAADTFGEDGDHLGKMNFINKIDLAFRLLLDAPHLLVVTADHSTPCALKKHSGDPVPIMMVGDGAVRTDDVTA